MELVIMLPKISLIDSAMVERVLSNDPETQHGGVKQFRRLLSYEPNPPIQDVLDTGLMPRFVELLSSPSADIQLEVAWVLTNIATGTTQQTEAVVKSGAIRELVKLLFSDDAWVAEQALWALSNIAGDNTRFRDQVLDAGVLVPLLQLIDRSWPDSMLRNAVWALSNLCRGKAPAPKVNSLKRAIPMLRRLLNSADEEIIANACWALAYLTQSSDDWIEEVVNADICKLLAQHLSEADDVLILSPCLRAVGNIISGNDAHTQVAIDCQVLPQLARLLDHHRPLIRRDAAWALSNVLAGTYDQIGCVLKANIVPKLATLLSDEDDRVKREAIWCISNGFYGGKPEQVMEIASAKRIFPPMIDYLAISDMKTIVALLNGLIVAFKLGESLQKIPEQAGEPAIGNPFTSECNVKNIRHLQSHEQMDIRQKAITIELRFFDTECLTPLDFGLTSANSVLRLEFKKRSN